MSRLGNVGQFTRNPISAESRLLIQSVCNHCGACQVASAQDGSLQEWEGDHLCHCQPQTESGPVL